MMVIDLTPSDAGYATIRDQFREAVDKHHEAIIVLHKMQDDDTIATFLEDYGDTDALDLFMEATSLAISERERSVQLLTEQIHEITRYLNSKLPQHSADDFNSDNPDVVDSIRR